MQTGKADQNENRNANKYCFTIEIEEDGAEGYGKSGVYRGKGGVGVGVADRFYLWIDKIRAKTFVAYYGGGFFDEDLSDEKIENNC